MSAARGRRVHFAAAEDIPASDAAVPSIGPVVFTAQLSGSEHVVDLSDLPCPRLVRGLAEALSRTAGDEGTQRTPRTVNMIAGRVRGFVKFVAATNADVAGSIGLADVTPQLLDSYEHKLIERYGQNSKLPYATMVDLIRLLKETLALNPGIFSSNMQARLGFSTTAAKYVMNPLDAYPVPVFEALQAKAMDDVRDIRDRILHGERLANAGRDPEAGGWTVENALWFIARHGPLTSEDLRRPGMADRFSRIGGINYLNNMLFLTIADLVPFQVLLTCLTGIEPECLRQLRADCLVNPARGYVSIAYVKRRAHGHSHRTVRVSDGGALYHPGGVLRLLIRLTARAREILSTDQIWVEGNYQGLRASFARQRTMSQIFDVWLARHRLDRMKERGGEPVRLDLRRLRKTYKSFRYIRSGGVLDDFAEGHTKQVAASHYANVEAHRELHETAVEDGLQEALDVALAPPVVLDCDGTRLDSGAAQLEPDEVRAALSGESDVFLASCRDFYASPYATKKGGGCPVAMWGCLECPNAVFTTRHLPSILTFLDFTEQQREELSVPEWKARYGLAWERIVHGLRPRFTIEQISTAQTIAEVGNLLLKLPVQFLEHSL
jgi:hypothetical protein